MAHPSHLETVHEKLLSERWHVLHFIGHGDYDTTADRGLIALVGKDGRADMVGADQLSDLFSEAQPTLRLVVLNSCSSGEQGTQDLFSGTAAALVSGGISAVAAMQFTVSDHAAITFAKGFYTALAHGRGIDDAVRSGRIDIVGTGSLEWVTPVLHVRGDTTQLFDLIQRSPPDRIAATPPEKDRLAVDRDSEAERATPRARGSETRRVGQTLVRTRNRRLLVAALSVAVLGTGVVLLATFLSGSPARYGQGSPPAPPPPTYTVTTVPVGNQPGPVAVDPASHTVYVGNRGDGSVSVINGVTPAATGTVHNVGLGPAGEAMDGNVLYVTNRDDATVAVIDGQKQTISGRVTVGNSPVGVAVDPLSHGVYVANHGDGTVSMIDKLAVTRTVKVGNSPNGVAVDPGTQTIYVANTGDGTVSVIDESGLAVTAPLTVGRAPFGVAVDPASHAVYVGNYGDGTVSVIDGLNHTVNATIHDVGTNPVGVAFDSGVQRVYVANSGDGTVSVIDASTHTVSFTVRDVGKTPLGVAADSVSHSVYVANGDDKTAAVIQSRRWPRR